MHPRVCNIYTNLQYMYITYIFKKFINLTLKKCINKINILIRKEYLIEKNRACTKSLKHM